MDGHIVADGRLNKAGGVGRWKETMDSRLDARCEQQDQRVSAWRVIDLIHELDAGDACLAHAVEAGQDVGET